MACKKRCQLGLRTRGWWPYSRRVADSVSTKYEGEKGMWAEIRDSRLVLEGKGRRREEKRGNSRLKINFPREDLGLEMGLPCSISQLS
jgi:hypothetical protein